MRLVACGMLAAMTRAKYFKVPSVAFSGGGGRSVPLHVVEAVVHSAVVEELIDSAVAGKLLERLGGESRLSAVSDLPAASAGGERLETRPLNPQQVRHRLS